MSGVTNGVTTSRHTGITPPTSTDINYPLTRAFPPIGHRDDCFGTKGSGRG